MSFFVDTSGWAAFFDRRQSFHFRAKQLLQSAWVRSQNVVSSNYVLAELTGLLTSPMRVAKPVQVQYLQIIRQHPRVVVVHIDPALDAAAWNLWQARPDKDWTVVDCASFIVMQQQRLTEALSTDHHFEQAGFVRLLK
jgi:predicted nucleic acid-binding protein